MANIFSDHDRQIVGKAIHQDLALPNFVQTAKQGLDESIELFKQDKQAN